MKSLIISGFTGIGKTEFAKNNPDAIDIDSATIHNKTGFEQIYIDKIIQNLGVYKFILVSTHRELRDILYATKLQTLLVYPQYGLKNEYIARCLQRGNSYAYAKHVKFIWDECIAELKNEKRFPFIELPTGKFLSDCDFTCFFN